MIDSPANTPLTPSTEPFASQRALLLAILVLAFALRAWNLHGTGFTSDEVSEANSAHASFPEHYP